ncbi:MAG: putative hydantoinase B/oxoprolinase [Rhizobacter sp.]|nr:putative hydantoinase B/oxoprolinase [Rhizobacter sp.]
MGGTFIDDVARGPDGRVHSLKHPREAGGLAGPVLQAVDRICAEPSLAVGKHLRLAVHHVVEPESTTSLRHRCFGVPEILKRHVRLSGRISENQK